jgi:hypothetical protein
MAGGRLAVHAGRAFQKEGCTPDPISESEAHFVCGRSGGSLLTPNSETVAAAFYFDEISALTSYPKF